MRGKYLTSMQEMPVLKIYMDKDDEAKKELEQKLSFLTKQAKNFSEEYNKIKKDCWENIEQQLMVRNLIEKKHTDPDYYVITFEKDHKQFFLQTRAEYDEAQDDMPGFLKHLMKATTRD